MTTAGTMPRRAPRRLAAVLTAAGMAITGSVALATTAQATSPPPSSVLAWGDNYLGQLGNGSSSTFSDTPVQAQLPQGATVTGIAAGGSHSLAVTSAGQVLTWGWNCCGQLGNGTTASQRTPAQIQLPQGVTATAVSGGNRHSLALTSTGSVYAWGSNADGQLGDGNTAQQEAPVPVDLPPDTTVTAISAGGFHNLALTSTGSVLAWGENGDGELGDGNLGSTSYLPVQVQLPPGVTATAVAAGGGFSLALTTAGQVLAWGDDFHGELGDGHTTDSDTPVQVALPAGTVVTAIAAGGDLGLALTSTGQVLAWGDNLYGDLGDGSTTERDTPVQVALPAGTVVTAIAAGALHSLALTSTGSVLAWGWNPYGELGDGTITSRDTPVQVALPAGTMVTAIAAGAGAFHSLALTAPAAEPAPTFTSQPAVSFTHGTPGSFTVSATPVDYARLCAYNNGNPLPAGFSFPVMCNGDPSGSHMTGGSSATLSFDGSSPGGQYTFTFYAVDYRNFGVNFNANQAIQPFTVTVYQAPDFTSGDRTTFTALRGNSFQVRASGGYPTGPITFRESGALPTGVTFSSGGLLSGQPSVADSGRWPITITADNGHATATQHFVLTVRAPRIAVPASAPAGDGMIQGVQLITTPGSTVTWSGSGYAPGAPVTLLAYPASTYQDPVLLGYYDADSTGDVTMTVHIPADLAGIQYLVAGGYQPNGTILYLIGQTDARPPGRVRIG